MSEFRPIFSAHAIERCSVSLAYGVPLPDKLYAQQMSLIVPLLEATGLKKQTNTPAFHFNVENKEVVRVEDDFAPATFASFDNAVELVVMPNEVIFTTHRYVSWSSFLIQFFTIVNVVVSRFDAFSDIGSVRLEYWDRFVWTGDWDDFRLSSLIKDDNNVVSKRLFEVQRDGHSHNGWYEYSLDERRVYNINVDILEPSTDQGSTIVSPSVGIYILVQDQAHAKAVQKFAQLSISERLEKLHDASKKQLSHLVHPTLAKRIGLRGE